MERQTFHAGIRPRKRLQWKGKLKDSMERLMNMSATKKKPPINARGKQTEQVNKKALLWIGVAFVVIVAALAVLLALNV
jgi:hypothetical protein